MPYLPIVGGQCLMDSRFSSFSSFEDGEEEEEEEEEEGVYSTSGSVNPLFGPQISSK
jgi:hypothetical protein